MKRRIRLTESDLHNIVKESVRRVLREEELGSSFGNMSAGEALAKVKEIEEYLRSISPEEGGLEDYDVDDSSNTKFSARSGGKFADKFKDRFPSAKPRL